MPKANYDFFKDFEPVSWRKNEESNRILSLKSSHGIKTNYSLHNLEDKINESRNGLEKVLISYEVNDLSYDLITLRTIRDMTYGLIDGSKYGLTGFIREEIARRLTKYFLQHFEKKANSNLERGEKKHSGKIGGLFNRKFNKEKRDGFIVADSKNYILKVGKYPNLFILKKEGKGIDGYEPIKELDGLFDYRFDDTKNFIIMESKKRGLNLKLVDKNGKNKLKKDLIKPLRELFPEYNLFFFLFARRNSILYEKTNFHSLKKEPENVYESLKKIGVPTLFFPFKETSADYNSMYEHIVLQKDILQKKKINVTANVIYSPNELVIKYNGDSPLIHLISKGNGLWEEVKKK